MKLADRVNKIQPSPTLAIDAKAKALKAQGVDVVGFGAGEPDFDTPENIREAGKKAIDAGFTRYMAVGGADDLKDAIIAKMKRDHGLEYTRDEISVACGAKHTLYNISQALIQEGDEVIIPGPYWVSYPDQVVLAGGTPVFIMTDESTGFKITPEQLDKAITPKTRYLILNSPCNPTGSTYSKEELAALGQVLLKHDHVLVVADDIYERLIYDGLVFYNIAQVVPELKSRTIVVNGVSKTYAMTGWRIGYIAAPAELISVMNRMHMYIVTHTSAQAQWGALAALEGPQEPVAGMVEEFRKRRDYVCRRIGGMKKVSCRVPGGAFYVFVNIKETGMGAEEFTKYLIREAHVAVVPGTAFGSHGEGYVRLSYAVSMENLEKSMDRIEKAVASL